MEATLFKISSEATGSDNEMRHVPAATTAMKSSELSINLDATSVPTAADTTKADLLTIPPELRLIVYDYYFSTFAFDQSLARKSDTGLQSDLLNTCRLLRHEALSMYKGHLVSTRQAVQDKHQQDVARITAEEDRLLGWGGFANEVNQFRLMHKRELAFSYWESADEAYAEELSKVEVAMRL